MGAKLVKSKRKPPVMVLGVGAFAYSVAQVLKEHGVSVATYLTRTYGHYAPSLAGPVFSRDAHPSPCPLIEKRRAGLVIPMSIDWAQAPWAGELRVSGAPIFGPTGDAMLIERDRDFARHLCQQHHIAFPRAFVARNRIEAERILAQHPGPYVLKNPLCSPTSPIHTIIGETLEDTRSWVRCVNYAEGVFLQEYLGRAEAGHIALISGGEIHSLVTNQEYKRAFDGNLGIVAGAPLGGLVELDPGDKYGLARELIHPLLPWFKEVNYHGPLQVTAIHHQGKWHVIEYNIRIGVTSGPMILRMLRNPLETLLATAHNRKIRPDFDARLVFGCSLTLAGYGYPYVEVHGPPLPVEVRGHMDCDLWWNEVARAEDGTLMATGHRIADVNALAATLPEAIQRAYTNLRKIRSVGSYYRTDVGQSLWPPGNI
jgi:phosphoribosylamine-glycine ligase